MKYQIVITVFEKKFPKIFYYITQQAKQMSEFNYIRFMTKFNNIKGKDVTKEFEKLNMSKGGINDSNV